jgi:hypothetical protein
MTKEALVLEASTPTNPTERNTNRRSGGEIAIGFRMVMGLRIRSFWRNISDHQVAPCVRVVVHPCTFVSIFQVGGIGR